jgi:hypothetical protein
MYVCTYGKSAATSGVIAAQEERLESALERMEAGDFLSDDDISVIRWACGKPSKPKSKLAPVFEDWASIFRKQGVI